MDRLNLKSYNLNYLFLLKIFSLIRRRFLSDYLCRSVDNVIFYAEVSVFN